MKEYFSDTNISSNNPEGMNEDGNMDSYLYDVTENTESSKQSLAEDFSYNSSSLMPVASFMGQRSLPLYSLSNYSFGTKDAQTEEDSTVQARLQRLQEDYQREGNRGSYSFELHMANVSRHEKNGRGRAACA
jgi:alpha-amylase/alpha-mannosidase (GH57 family)